MADLVRSCQKKWIVLAACPVALLSLLFFVTSHHPHGSAVSRFVQLPVLSIDVGPSDKWIVQSGVNIVTDQGKGMAGNVVEFPIGPGFRAGIRFFSTRWWQEKHAKQL